MRDGIRSWYRNAGSRKGARPVYHAEADDWIQSGNALCGRRIPNPGFVAHYHEIAALRSTTGLRACIACVNASEVAK